MFWNGKIEIYSKITIPYDWQRGCKTAVNSVFLMKKLTFINLCVSI